MKRRNSASTLKHDIRQGGKEKDSLMSRKITPEGNLLAYSTRWDTSDIIRKKLKR